MLDRVQDTPYFEGRGSEVLAKRILVCCGAGVATSTMVAVRLQEMLGAKGIDAVCEHCKVMEVAGMADRFDLLVSNVAMEHDVGIPVVMGLPFITGVGREKALEEVMEKLGA